MTSNDLSPASITDNLSTSFIGRRVIYHPRIPSTMDAARREGRLGAPEGTVVIAGEQTEGRGRVKRAWLSPRGNVALSVVLYPDISYLPCLVMMAALAVVRSIEAVAGLEPRIKWPNDILISGKKAGGILTESEVKGGRVVYAVIGIGLNIALELSDFPAISSTATAINSELGREVPPVDIIRRILVEMERLYRALPAGGPVYEEWRDRLVTLGKRVRVQSGGSLIEGYAESVDRNGALLLRCADGTLVKVVAGDVTLRDGQDCRP